ncbi:hypothetical protein DC31_09540 [Microbacterium sp. CH12i]|uniref:rhamnan synthesis F family protein n=1 Tax=Microbacterium sp. CH12i TaxID=1479651 RepID=UPI000460AE92|nr:rhamnan synthesis F family protein [Microbacterium sp. CH12i]KDA06686.1 hypothetical protein DC31_09540 [Microbacterium sp. CH12i]
MTVPDTAQASVDAIAELGARYVSVSTSRFSPVNYWDAFKMLAPDLGEIDEIVLTGEGWFGPFNTLGGMIERMDAVSADAWQVAEFAGEVDASFDAQEHPAVEMPWAWFVARRPLFETDGWRRYWDGRHGHDAVSERFVANALSRAGYQVEYAFRASDYPTANAVTHVPDLLIDQGYPFLDRGVFGWFPPYLDRHGIIGHDILDVAEQHGLDRDETLSVLARTVQPRTLNANAGLFEILPQHSVVGSAAAAKKLRVAAVVYARDLPAFERLCGQLANIPTGFDLVVTTTDGRKAARIERFVEAHDLGNAHLDVRVTPSGKGRDMADFFVGCHDLLLGRKYDVLIKVHARKHSKKTLNVVRYFTRYQTENLLASPQYVENLLDLFATKPHLGLVFPPMMHVGYSILGKGWGGGRYRVAASAFLRKLDVRVPLEKVSPLAPFGGMWMCRPEALGALAEQRVTYRDYSTGSSMKDLARVQERVLAHVAGEAGYYAQTVLTSEHASISHTILDYKVDQLFSTMQGYPVDAIQLMQRTGRISGRGIFGLSRMYLNLNHPVLARIVSPAYRLAYTAIWVAKFGRRAIRSLDRQGHSRSGGL